MGVRVRVDDALLLWRHGRKEGAFLNALVAVAASSRRRFPDRKSVKDNQAFTRFVEAAHTVRIGVEFRGECLPIEQVLYKWVRCQLVHEAELPLDLQFMPDETPGEMAVRAGGAPEYILKLSEGWFHHLIASVVGAPENASEFRDSHA